jgi:DDE superfamily endonuclease
MTTVLRCPRRTTGQHARSGQRQRRQRRPLKRRRASRHPRHPAPLPGRIRRVTDALVLAFRAAFTRPTYERFVVLLLAAILTTGCRTVLNLLRTIDALAPGHPSSYHRVFSRRRCSLWRLGRALAGYLLQRWAPTGVVPVAGDDTVAEHKGQRVYGKARHRDAVRSSHCYTAFRWGHKWVVLAILVRFPFATRPWALPVLVALYRSEQDNQRQGRRHKTPPELLRQLLAVLCRWFPQRQFVCTADGNFATHPLARFAARHRRRLTLVSRFYADAALYAPPPPAPRQRGKGRPRVKGAKQATPEEVVAQARRRQRLNAAWYGGGRRDIAVVSGTGQWYRAGEGLVAVRWVYVEDRAGTHRPEYFFTTDPRQTPQQVVEAYTGRWNIETTFEEMRSYLKLEKTRGWKETTVLRTAPCLFGLYAVIALWYAELPGHWRGARAVSRAEPGVVTFSDAITAVRRWLWSEWVFATPAHNRAFAKIPPRLRDLLLRGLAPTA